MYINLRAFTALLLIALLTMTALARPQTEPDDATSVQTEEKITPAEEQEAREIAALLTMRWQETDDIEPLIKEFFISDFAARIHYEPQMLFLAEVKPNLLGPESSDDLRRHYVAMTNFVRLMLRLQVVYQSIRASDEDHGFKSIVPTNIWNLLKSNPALNALLHEETGETSEGQTSASEAGAESREDARNINTIEQLRSLTNTLEQAVLLLRDHLKTLPLTLPASEIRRNEQSEADSSTAENNDPLMPRVYILNEDFYGYTPGTRLICINVLPFHIDLVRVGQHLKVLSVYIQTD